MLNTTSFNKNNLQDIKDIFEEKTGVALSPRRNVRHPVRTAAVLVAILACCLSLTAFAISMFSSLSGDDLGFSATYVGNGIVSVEVENKSDKVLTFQPTIKLMLWSTGEEVTPISDNVIFTGVKIEPRSKGTMTIDLSGAYDIEMLEKPLVSDHYYFVLTNNNFVFGQDWMCSVEFADHIVSPAEPATPATTVPPVQTDKTAVEAISEELRDYFENITFDIDERQALNAEYVQSYTTLFEQFDRKIVSSVSPFNLLIGDAPSGVIYDDSVAADEQYLLVGRNWFSSDANFKMLATEKELSLTVSALLPSKKYTSKDTGTYIPLFYILVYDKSEIENKSDYAFIHGQLFQFADLEQYKVYENEQYVCYETSALIYSDLTEYVQGFVSRQSDIRYDEQVKNRLENIYSYFQENIGNLFFTR